MYVFLKFFFTIPEKQVRQIQYTVMTCQTGSKKIVNFMAKVKNCCVWGWP